MIAVGSDAPDFELRSHTGQTVRLSSFRDKKQVVVAFHPLAFTPVCAVQMQAYQKALPKLDAMNTHVVAISVDASPSKQAWADSLGGISYDLLSDFFPHGKTATDYGVMRDDGITERAVFVVDKQGKIAWAKQYGIPEQPDLGELLKALEPGLHPGMRD